MGGGLYLIGAESDTRKEERMNKCDKCENMARVTVSGFIVARYLCAYHAGELCLSVGDTAGHEKFNALVMGDRVAV